MGEGSIIWEDFRDKIEPKNLISLDKDKSWNSFDFYLIHTTYIYVSVSEDAQLEN